MGHGTRNFSHFAREATFVAGGSSFDPLAAEQPPHNLICRWSNFEGSSRIAQLKAAIYLAIAARRGLEHRKADY